MANSIFWKNSTEIVWAKNLHLSQFLILNCPFRFFTVSWRWISSIFTMCGPRFWGWCSIKQVGHHGWPTEKILNSRLSKTCLNHILYIFFSIRTNILIVYYALQINGTVSLWSALYGFSVAACVKYASHNFTKTNVKTEFQKYINS